MSQLKSRLLKLEQSRQHATNTPKRLIGTQIIATDDTALHGTHSAEGDMFTFYNATLKQAFADREQWLSEQSNLIAMVAPFDTGQRVLEVIAERHADG